MGPEQGTHLFMQSIVQTPPRWAAHTVLAPGGEPELKTPGLVAFMSLDARRPVTNTPPPLSSFYCFANPLISPHRTVFEVAEGSQSRHHLGPS